MAASNLANLKNGGQVDFHAKILFVITSSVRAWRGVLKCQSSASIQTLVPFAPAFEFRLVDVARSL